MKKTFLQQENIFLLVVLLLCLALFWAVNWEYLSSALVVNNDERQVIMPYLAFHQTGVLKESLIQKYMFSYNPLGHRGIYFLLTFLFSPFVAAKVLSVVLCGLLLLYCYRIGKISVPAAGLVLAIFVLRGASFTIFIGGLPRSFGLVLVFMYLYYFLAGRRREVLIVFLLQAAFYPSALIICSASYGIYLLIEAYRKGAHWFWRPAISFALTLLLCFLLLLPLLRKPSFVGSVVTLKEASTMPVFGPGGRFKKVLPFDPIQRVTGKASVKAFQPTAWPFTAGLFMGHRGFQLISLFWFGLGMGFLVFAKQRTLLWKILCFLAAGVIMCLVARVLAFRFFLPFRLVTYSWTFATPVVCCLGLANAPNLKIGGRNVCLPQVLFLLFLLCIYVFSPFQYKGRWNLAGLVDGRLKNGLYEFFSRCPKDSMIAGDPYELDNVMSFSERKAYVTYEASHPLYLNYYKEIRRRYDALHAGYFSSDAKLLANFLREERIDYLLVNRNHLMANGAHYRIFEPLGSELKTRLKDVQKHTFILSRPDLPGIVFVSHPFVVVEAKKFLLAVTPSPHAN